jgi:hypothetical protein
VAAIWHILVLIPCVPTRARRERMKKPIVEAAKFHSMECCLFNHRVH